MATKAGGEVEPLLRKEKKGLRLSSAAGWRRFRKHSVPKSSNVLRYLFHEFKYLLSALVIYII